MWTDYHSKFHQNLKNRLLLPKNTKILIAVSGGQDSLSLAKLSLDLQEKWSWNLAIAHFDHSWALDEGLGSHVEKIAKNWGIEFYLVKATEKILETEADARKYRYEGLMDIATKYQFNYLITGHTLSDRAETFIYNLIRGAGMEGLSALNWTRKLTDNLTLVRPLLNFTRGDTLAFCQKLQLPIWEDKYNDNKKFARNRIRLDLIPYLKKEFNPQIEQHLTQTVEILRADVEFLTQEAEKLLNLAISEDKNSLKRSILKEKPLSLQRRVIKAFLAQNLKTMPNFEQIEQIVRLIDAPNRSRTSSLNQGMFAQVEGDLIRINCL
ncbi:MAG: tRNA lysidine(34) synthetase TilS [Cyanobacteria bacterium]|nr:tRNA lysidine(34) synthetase TilS [Cyanobacteria bacterium CG_2015-16_32_12]NCO78993.1 tRNA lysidine(34) synthetase TilS [Cyanobacteria bacterium CG_2015-22_32_23]NCQ04040.1 tRNA lysidine(34) synthetase TilS [Cyanobacteria bacterium CG_2015-09_32_10]NCQ42242.1 tRNA lysidine(34) synthetase TilS [Cyanobacteria bacterium CG_2015-04_32_10]NCS85145.1 tRNA lysidine(34) synthetase TilS [Cyanobacteria bacterium CG_2015-02_32_10]